MGVVIAVVARTEPCLAKPRIAHAKMYIMSEQGASHAFALTNCARVCRKCVSET